MTKKRTNLAELSYSQFFTEVAELLEQARKYSARSVNAIMTHTYWEVGRRIVEHEQWRIPPVKTHIGGHPKVPDIVWTFG